MSVQQSTAPSQVQRFWDNYLKVLHQEGIRHPFDQWYVKPAEAFLRSSPRRLSERSAGDVDWNYWRDAARTLAKDHPTVARSMDQLPQTKAATGDDRSDEGSLAVARKKHVELITELARAMTLHEEDLKQGVGEVYLPEVSVLPLNDFVVGRRPLRCGRAPSQLGSNWVFCPHTRTPIRPLDFLPSLVPGCF